MQVFFETPEYSANADALGTLRLLEAIRILKMTEKVKFYQVSTSELYRKVQEIHRLKRLLFIQEVPMRQQRFIHIGLLLTIERHAICMHVMEYYLIMNHPLEVKHLLLGR